MVFLAGLGWTFVLYEYMPGSCGAGHGFEMDAIASSGESMGPLLTCGGGNVVGSLFEC